MRESELAEILKNPHIRINEQHAAGAGAVRKSKPVPVQQYTRTDGRPNEINLTLPYLLPTLNDRQKTGWQRAHMKQHWIKRLQKDVAALIAEQYGAWTYAPYDLASITIERVSSASREPDQDNLAASVKELLDVIQPLHPTIRPYGLGIIAGDHPAVLQRSIQWRRPVSGEDQQTLVSIRLAEYYDAPF